MLRNTRKLLKLSNKMRAVASPLRRKLSSDLYEPDYLKEMQPKIPIYDTLNIQLRGYDYPILENYQKFIHKIAKNMEIDVEDSWALPAVKQQVSTFRPQSDVVQEQFHLNVYQRTVQIVDCSSSQLPVLIRAIEASQPEGVSVNITKHDFHDEEVRYIPDSELRQLKHELDEMGGPTKKK